LRERRGANNPHFIHGASQTPEYCALRGAIRRCTNPNSAGYRWYGGRGIQVAEDFRGENGFQNFIKEVGLRPSPLLSLDRIDNDKGYQRGNLRWATKSVQNRNQRHNTLKEVGTSLSSTGWQEASL
jgi:hypothetical protein